MQVGCPATLSPGSLPLCHSLLGLAVLAPMCREGCPQGAAVSVGRCATAVLLSNGRGGETSQCHPK